MARKPATATPQRGAPSVPKDEDRTKPAAMAKGAGQKLSRESAQAIADASTAAGFPVPPQAAAVLAQPVEAPAAAEPSSPPPAAGDAEPQTEA